MLETERLTLRGHRVEDFSACAAMWADPIVTRFISGKPQTSEEAWHRMLRYAGHWALMGFGYWVIEEKTTGAFLGEAGFADFKRNIEPPIVDTPEAGWIFSPAAHGKGFATEAVQAIHDWGRTHFEARRSACIIHPENSASLRLAQKIGYSETLQTTYRNSPMVLLHRSW
jgi:RimJ/RimL family protein N-acetyltransferase